MIIDKKKKWIQTPKGWYGIAQKVMTSLRDWTAAWAIFYNPAIPSGLKLRKVSY